MTDNSKLKQQVALTHDGRVLELFDHVGVRRRYHAMWLRDNAQDEATRSPVNGQRLLTLADIPVDTAISGATLEAGKVMVTFTPECKVVEYSVDWLKLHCYDNQAQSGAGHFDSELETWDAQLTLPGEKYNNLGQSPLALHTWLRQLRRYGVARVSEGPLESGALLDVAALFGHVRKTNYGEYFDVRTEVNPTNLAYTGMGLQAHTDNPYRDPVPTMQILYCLENSASGGESIVIDGFRACQLLLQSDPEAFRLLSRYCARFEYVGSDGVCLRSRKPIIELSVDGRVEAVRFNNRSTAAITDVPFDLMEQYYAAYRRFGQIIDDPSMAVSFKLEPGEGFIVDNRRVLHARSGYDGSGSRWLQGCYPDIDGLLSKLAVLESGSRAVFDQ